MVNLNELGPLTMTKTLLETLHFYVTVAGDSYISEFWSRSAGDPTNALGFWLHRTVEVFNFINKCLDSRAIDWNIASIREVA